MHPFLPQQPLFKAYDIRGDYQYFTDDFVQALGQAFAHLYLEQQASYVVVGHDVRIGSHDIAQQLAHALQQHDIEVIWLGLVSSPMMAFWANEYEGHGLIVTASHSPKHINGIKWLVAGKSPSADDILQLFYRMYQATITLDLDGVGEPFYPPPTLETVMTPYLTALQKALSSVNQQVPPSAINDQLRPCINIAIDCLNGATGLFAKSIFQVFFANVHVLNAKADGSFPKGNPDPTEEQRLKELQTYVLDKHMDIGLSFDGDGDRLMVVDDLGRLVAPDHLLYLLANIAIIQAKPSVSDDRPHVLFDVKCSHHLSKLISKSGGLPIMSKTGSSLMRQALQKGGHPAIFAGELSGHFLFNDGYFILYDDAVYAGLRLLNWLVNQNKPLSQIIDELPKMVSTADVYVSVKDNAKNLVSQILSSCQSLFSGSHITKKSNNPPSITATEKASYTITHDEIPSLTSIDGIRLDFDKGFGVIRPSNTSANITVRFAGNTLEDLKSIQAQFVAICQPFSQQLAQNIANIHISS